MAKQLGHCTSLTLLTRDVTRATSFYESVLGVGVWEVSPSSGRILAAGRVAVGRIAPAAEAARPGWVPTFAVAAGAVAGAVRVAIASGGARARGAALQGAAPASADAVLQDAQGARFCVAAVRDAGARWDTHPPTAAAGGALDWATRPVQGSVAWLDQLADSGAELQAADFYRGVLGWRGLQLPPFPGGAYHVMFSGRGTTNADKTCGILTRGLLLGPRVTSAMWLPFFEAGSDAGVASAASAASAVGAEVVAPPTPTKDGAFTILRDVVRAVRAAAAHSRAVLHVVRRAQAEDTYFAVYNRTDSWGETRTYDVEAR